MTNCAIIICDSTILLVEMSFVMMMMMIMMMMMMMILGTDPLYMHRLASFQLFRTFFSFLVAVSVRLESLVCWST